MPMCHANSLNFFGAFSYCGGVHRRSTHARASIPSTACGRSAESGATFTSLVPTHYIMMLGLPAAMRGKLDLDRVRKLMISSAPARRDTKREIMEMFPNSGLFELYGSTEAGWVTMLHPARAVHESRLGRARMRRLGADQAARRGRQRGARTASRASSIRATPVHVLRLLEPAARRPPRRSAATTARSATWRAATPDGYITSGRPQEQHDHLGRREHLSVRGRGGARRPPEGQGRRGHRPARPEMGRAGACRRRAARRRADATRRKSSTGAATRSPATSDRGRSPSSREDEMPRTATGKVLHRVLRTQLARRDGRPIDPAEATMSAEARRH